MLVQQKTHSTENDCNVTHASALALFFRRSIVTSLAIKIDLPSIGYLKIPIHFACISVHFFSYSDGKNIPEHIFNGIFYIKRIVVCLMQDFMSKSHMLLVPVPIYQHTPNKKIQYIQ